MENTSRRLLWFLPHLPLGRDGFGNGPPPSCLIVIQGSSPGLGSRWR